jgi:hypothetical protein
MTFCGNCGKNVKPNIYFRWNGFIRGLGIFYLMYIAAKIPQCPNCNFPLPRRTMVLAVHLPRYFIKLAGMVVLHLTRFKDQLLSALRSSDLIRKTDPSQHFAGMKTHQTTSFNMMVNEVHNSIHLESYEFRK